MKIRSIAAAALFALSGQAFALTPAQVAASDTVKVYVSGATALRNIIGGLFTQNCSADIDIFYSSIGTFGGISFGANGDAHRVYACTMKADSPILAGKQVAFFKSDIGGSGQGVFPVYFGGAEGATRPFLNLSTCGAKGSYGSATYLCTGEQTQVAMAGVSDVEPGLFKGINVPGDDPNYPPDGLSETQLADLDTAPMFQLVAAVAVNKALRDALQTEQGLTAGSEAEADRPSISRIQATSLFTGGLGDPTIGLGWQSLVSASDAKRNSRVNVCRRVNGSGTQAMANAFITEFPCNGNGPIPADASYSDAGLANATASVGPNGKLFVFEGSTTGNVISCLGAAEDTGAYAIGHVSKENNEAATGSKWRHVKVDGIAANRDNVKKGKYTYFYESTMQWHVGTFAGLSDDQKTFLTDFRAEASRPSSLAKLAVANQEGVAASPESYAGGFGTGTVDEIKFGSRVLRGGNSCNLPVVVK